MKVVHRRYCAAIPSLKDAAAASPAGDLCCTALALLLVTSVFHCCFYCSPLLLCRAVLQYLAWKTLLQPHLQKDEDAQAAADAAAWAQKATERKRLGIGPPLQPTSENAWRLEQMYDDD